VEIHRQESRGVVREPVDPRPGERRKRHHAIDAQALAVRLQLDHAGDRHVGAGPGPQSDPGGEALRDAGAEPIRDLRPVLATEFQRFSLAARAGSERATCDLALRLSRVDDDSQARLGDERVVLETKSEDGDSAINKALRDAGIGAVAMSKYRLGIDLLVEPDSSGETAGLGRLFKRVAADA